MEKKQEQVKGLKSFVSVFATEDFWETVLPSSFSSRQIQERVLDAI